MTFTEPHSQPHTQPHTQPQAQPQLRHLPARDVLAVDGVGATDSPSFGAAVQALFAVRAELGGGDVPLEGTYRHNGEGDFDLQAPDSWRWTLTVPAPDGTSEGRRCIRGSEDGRTPSVRRVEQPASDVLELEHRGPYAEEAPTLAALRAAAASRDLRIVGPHTETYLNDPRITAPDQLRTLLRYPVA